MSRTFFRNQSPVVQVKIPLESRPQMTNDKGQRTSGFTLVEMLVVITIISILVALASVAVFKALETAKKARIKAEITNLESAMQQFKTQYGDYPPSWFGPVQTDAGVVTVTEAAHPVRQFFNKAFPRLIEPDTTWQNLKGQNLKLRAGAYLLVARV